MSNVEAGSETVYCPLPYTTRIDKRGDFRMSSHTAMVTEATRALLEKNPDSTAFIPGESSFGVQYPSTAEKMKEQLIKKGIEESRIRTQDNLNDTETQLRAIQKQGIQNPKVVAIGFHEKRSKILMRQIGLNGQIVNAEKVILRTHDGATQERLDKISASKVKMLGMSKVYFAETVAGFGVQLGKPGKAIVKFARKLMHAEGATVTDYHFVEPGQKHLADALADPLRRERVLSHKKH